MTSAHFIVAALALASALAGPVAEPSDRYKDESHAEATDPGEATTDDVERQKRGYASWIDYEGFSRWKPATYQISRPYFIPVYGAPGGVPIYFPPQQLHLNPGYPVDNPVHRRRFKGPVYLPPTTERTTTTTMNIVNRNFDDDDDRPVWGTSQSKSNSDQNSIVPTRAPRPQNTEFPPLVHDINRGQSNSPAANSQAAVVATSRSTTPRPVSSGPSNCVWAIISCCSASSAAVPDACFEQRGCPGPFWGSSPCESDYAKAAVASAMNYYQQQ